MQTNWETRKRLSIELYQEPPRDYLDEALRIVNGESILRPQKQHLEAVVEKLLKPPFSFEPAPALGFSDIECRKILGILIGWFGAGKVHPEAAREFTRAMTYAARQS